MAKRRRRRTHRVRPDRCREGLRAAPQLWSKPFPLLFLPLMGGVERVHAGLWACLSSCLVSGSPGRCPGDSEGPRAPRSLGLRGITPWPLPRVPLSSASLLLYPASLSVSSRRAPRVRFQNPRHRSSHSRMKGLSLLTHSFSEMPFCLNHAVPCQAVLPPSVQVSAAKGGSLWLHVGLGGSYLSQARSPGLRSLPLNAPCQRVHAGLSQKGPGQPTRAVCVDGRVTCIGKHV